jgi:hypothetical protein
MLPDASCTYACSCLHAECRRFESVTAHQPSQAQRREGCRAECERNAEQQIARRLAILRLRWRAGGEWRATRLAGVAGGGNQTASLSSFEARKATFLLALI